MYSYDEIRHVHIEPTTKCNAGCPMCARNSRGQTVAGLPLVELSSQDVKRIFSAEFLRQLDGFDLCGAYGDPAAARDLIEIVEYIRLHNAACKIVIYSNGGLRTPDWWTALAKALGPTGTAVFAIDGLEDTNAIHRRDVKFTKVIDNAQAFISVGGRARWEFLAFKHNEHQIEFARQLSEEMGFIAFSLKKSARFIEPLYEFIPEYTDHSNLLRFPIFARNGEVTGFLEPAENPQFVNKSVLTIDEENSKYVSLNKFFSETEIDCRVASTKSMFMSARGHVFPCCWTYVQATRPVMNGSPDATDYQIVELLNQSGGLNRVDAKLVGLQRAIESPFFDAIESSWSCTSIEAGRAKVCARACGRDFPAYFDQFADLDLLPRGLKG